VNVKVGKQHKAWKGHGKAGKPGTMGQGQERYVSKGRQVWICWFCMVVRSVVYTDWLYMQSSVNNNLLAEDG
jgi:hypothetical protein